MMEVCLLGTGGMMPLPQRHLTALWVRSFGTSFLIDCGEGTQVSMRRVGWSFKDIDTIFLTHMHGDHVAGLPGLLLSIGNCDRTEPVNVFGPKGTARVVKGLLVAAPELPFSVKVQEIGGGETVETGPFRITATALDHGIPCLGYRIDLPRRPLFLPEKAKENNVPLKAWNPLQKGNSVEIDGVLYTPDMVLGEERKGLTVAYMTDTRPTEGMVKAAENADLLICEGMYGEEEKKTRSHKYKHMTFREAAVIARDAGAKELWLTHYSPSLVKPQDFLEEATSVFPATVAQRDRASVTLRFEDEENGEEAGCDG